MQRQLLLITVVPLNPLTHHLTYWKQLLGNSTKGVFDSTWQRLLLFLFTLWPSTTPSWGVHGLDFPEPHPATMKHHVELLCWRKQKSVNSLPQKILHGWHISSWTCDLTCHSLHIATTHTPHNIILTAFAGEYLSWDKSVSIAPVG